MTIATLLTPEEELKVRLRLKQRHIRAPVAPPSPLAWATANAKIVTPSQGVAPWEPFEYQKDLLNDTASRRLVLKARQTGLSTSIALEALYHALHHEYDRTLFVSRNQELAGLLIRYVQVAIAGLSPQIRTVSESQSKIVFPNGSEIVSLPANPATGRGYPASRLYLDEFAFAEYADLIYQGILPTLSEQGQMTVLSTPKGRNNLFYRLWQGLEGGQWSRHTVHWSQCPRYTPSWAEQTRANMTRQAFAEEFDCHLPDTLVVKADGGVSRVADLRPGDVLLSMQDGITVSCSVVMACITGVKSLVKVTTESGTIFRASRRHKVVTSDGKLPLHAAADLAYVPIRKSQQTRECALARLVGFNMGDGTIARQARSRPRRTGPHVEISLRAAFYSKYADDLVPLASDVALAGLASKASTVRLKRGLGGPRGGDTYQIQLSPSASARLHEAGCPVGKKIEQAFVVPAWITTGSDDVKREFLAALWGAEGTTPAQNRAKGKYCSEPTLSMWKVELADGVEFFARLAAMHRDLGVDVVIRNVQSRGRWRFALVVRSEKSNVQRFFTDIGYRYAARKELLAFQWAQYYGAYNYDGQVRQDQVVALRASGSSYAEAAIALGYRTELSVRNISRSRPSQARRSFPFFDDWLGSRWRNGALYLKIVDTEDEGEALVQNITVNSPDHSYLLADGLNNFNCDFLSSGDAVFDADDLLRCRQGYVSGREGCDKFVTAWDIGRRQDHSVGITLGRRGQVWHLVEMERFMLPFPATQAKIEARKAKYPGQHVVESNGIGDPVTENLLVKVSPFTTTPKTKVQALQSVQLLLQQSRLKYDPQENDDHAQLDRELSLYTWDDRNIVQDCVLALAIAAYQIEHKRPSWGVVG